MLAVIGSIYTGVATATEASALGVLGAIVLSPVQRTLAIEMLKESIMGSVRTTAMIMTSSEYLSLVMGFIGRASFPMFLVMAAFIVLLFLFPGMATWLPEALSK